MRRAGLHGRRRILDEMTGFLLDPKWFDLLIDFTLPEREKHILMTIGRGNRALRIMFYFLLWLFASVCMTIIYLDTTIPVFPQLLTTSMGTLLSLPLAAYAANVLVPKYIYHKNISGFVWRMLPATSISVVAIYFICAILYHALTGRPVIRSAPIMWLIILLSLFTNLIFISVFCGVRIIRDRYFLEQKLEETEKEKISAELNFLRSQINPHFLFNVLNTIYFQIDKTNVQARNSIERFSEMLRYQLYDCKTDRIEIKREIEYIQSYVSIQRLRLDEGTDIRFQLGSGLEGFAIAPFMFLTLVENAFKHISHFKTPSENKIHIDIRQESDQLIVKVQNTFEKGNKVQHLQESGGMGMQNLKRRIQLLYPKHAELAAKAEGNMFEATLNVRYNDQLPGGR